MKQLRATFPNIEFENRWMSYSAYVDKISLITSTGDLADLQFANAFNDMPLMMDSSLLLETGPLLDKVGTHIKAATPPEALTVSVPLSVPPPGLVPMATVIDAVLLLTVLPKASWTVTWTAGLILAPAAVVDG